MKLQRLLGGTALTLAVSLVAVVALGAYLSVGWKKMDKVCSTDIATPAGTIGGPAFSWSWIPPGFQCTWLKQDGTGEISVTKLWWNHMSGPAPEEAVVTPSGDAPTPR